MSELSRRAYARLCHVAALLSMAYLAGFIADVVVPKSVDRGAGPLGPALPIDLSLLVLFGVQHSGMARRRFHDWWAARLPASLERASYVLATAAVLALLFWLWQPLPRLVVELTAAWAVALAWLLFGGGWALIAAATLSLGAAELFGLAQARRTAPRPEVLLTPWLYRRVRHPLQAGIVLVLWATPSLTLGHALLAGGFSTYIALGIHYEERELLRTFGKAYAEYRERVPALLPCLPGLPRAWSRAIAIAALATLALLLLQAPQPS